MGWVRFGVGLEHFGCRKWGTVGTSRPAGIQPLLRPPGADPKSVPLLSRLIFLCVRPSICLPFLCYIFTRKTQTSSAQWLQGGGYAQAMELSPLGPAPWGLLLHPEPVWPLGTPSKAHPLPLCTDCASSRSWLSRACSDVQKFLPPSRGWMRRLCDLSGLPSHAEPL